jgi:glycosyltransferase involved in cell wall biosynthesis
MTRTQVALLTLGDPARVTGGYLFHRRLADRAARYDMAITFVSIADRPLPWAMLTGLRWLRAPAIRGADVVILDSIAAAVAAPWLVRLQVPLLGMLHQPLGGMDAGPFGRWVRAPFDRWAYGRTELLMVASEWLAAQLVAAGIHRRRLHVIPPGKDPAPTDGREAGGAEVTASELRLGRDIAALCVANWLPRKGILELLEAVARLPDKLVTLHLVGDPSPGDYGGYVLHRLGQEDLQSRVVTHGVIPAGEVAQLYRSADAFALPSFEEPYGTVWGEAMAAGLPVIGWRAGNLPYLADHEREGLLAPVGDIAALSDAIARIARDSELREQMGEAARARAGGRPTWDETADLFFTVVDRVVHRRPSPQRAQGPKPSGEG